MPRANERLPFLHSISSLASYFPQGFSTEMSLNEELEKESQPSTLWELCISGDVEGVAEAVRRGDQVFFDTRIHLILLCCVFGISFFTYAGKRRKRPKR